ncbi:MAG: D-sedoheptulose 7-phosphate isomerase [Cyclobacteriaceae bacterium]
MKATSDFDDEKWQEMVHVQLLEAHAVLDRTLTDSTFQQNIYQAAKLISESFRQGGKVLACGNGGSLCDAMHFAEELTGRFRDDRRPLPALAITDPGYISCASNDYGYAEVFSRAVAGLGNDKDVLLAISTSGNSENILKAANTAKTKGMKVIALTGNNGGKLSSIADIEIRSPHSGYSDRIQEVHIKAIHIMIFLIEQMID